MSMIPSDWVGGSNGSINSFKSQFINRVETVKLILNGRREIVEPFYQIQGPFYQIQGSIVVKQR